jgi:hypothetical protein
MRLRTVGGNAVLGHDGQNGCMDSEASDTARAVRRHGGRRLYGASAVRGSAAPGQAEVSRRMALGGDGAPTRGPWRGRRRPTGGTPR